MNRYKKIKLNKFIKRLSSKFFEKTLVYIVTIIALILLATQIGLMSDYIRPYLSDIEVFEGNYINQIDTLIKKGKIKLQLINMKNESDIKVLVNGIEVGKFDKRLVEVEVKNNSVVEVDASEIESPVKVRIVSMTRNIKGASINDEIVAHSNIEVVCRVKID